MTDKIKIDDALLDTISAYVDGELSADEARQIERLALQNSDVQSEIDALKVLNQQLKQSFDALLEEDTPKEETTLGTPPLPKAANSNQKTPLWMRVSAALVLFVFGAASGGYLARFYAPVEVVKSRGWMAHIADYHRIYAGQKRHLVEVAADEKDHIESWLSKTVAIDLVVPDLTTSGFEFQGARLLVAGRAPVAQLMYRNAGGDIIAICGLQTTSQAKDGFSARSFDDVDMVRWDRSGASFVVVGNKGTDLLGLAQRASTVL